MPSYGSACRDLLVWTVLTASTIGPGTVTMCSKAGADFGTSLFWATVIAAIVAWVMQEGTGRLTIASGLTLGEAVRSLSPSGLPLLGRHLLALFCIVGNFAYQCNNFAGTMAAVEIMLLPPSQDSSDASSELAAAAVNCSLGAPATSAQQHSRLDSGPTLAVRQAVNALLWPLTFALFLSGTRRLSLLCSAVVGGMILCFVVTLAGAGVPDVIEILHGLVPSIPSGAAEVVLAVMGTTSIPVNILMGSSLARSAGSLSAMRHGVALASALSGLVSLLVQLVGTRVPPHPPCLPFELRDVAHVLQSVMGDAGFYGFGIGLFGAGLSSALTIPMGCALSIEDLYGLHQQDDASSPGSGCGGGGGAAARGGISSGVPSCARACGALADADGALGSARGGGGGSGRLGGRATAHGAGWSSWSHAKRWHVLIRPLSMAAFLGLSLLPSLLRLPTIAIITTAQVVNGLLLPCVASLLFVCLNHSEIMGTAGPQEMLLNVVMAPCVGITFLLACVFCLKHTLGRLVGEHGPQVAIVTSMPIALGLLLLLVRRALLARRASTDRRRSRPRARTQPGLPWGVGGTIEISLSQPTC